MKPLAAKVVEFNKSMEMDAQVQPEISEAEFEEAIALLGLDQPAFSFSGDYEWMIETTRQILQREGMGYFRKNVSTLMKAWEDFVKG